MNAQCYATLDILNGAHVLKAERVGLWLQLSTDKGEVHVAAGRVRLDLGCPKCREERLVEVVDDPRGAQGFCSVCSFSWALERKPVRVGSTGE